MASSYHMPLAAGLYQLGLWWGVKYELCWQNPPRKSDGKAMLWKFISAGRWLGAAVGQKGSNCPGFLAAEAASAEAPDVDLTCQEKCSLSSVLLANCCRTHITQLVIWEKRVHTLLTELTEHKALVQASPMLLDYADQRKTTVWKGSFPSFSKISCSDRRLLHHLLSTCSGHCEGSTFALSW